MSSVLLPQWTLTDLRLKSNVWPRKVSTNYYNTAEPIVWHDYISHLATAAASAPCRWEGIIHRKVLRTTGTDSTQPARSRLVVCSRCPAAAATVQQLPCERTTAQYPIHVISPADGPPVSLKDGHGRFLKKLQAGDRSEREVAFYQEIERYRQPESAATNHTAGLSATDTTEHDDCMQQLAQWVPRSYGVTAVYGAEYLVLEDIAAAYRQPCVMDIKIGYRTWYPWATEKQQEKYRKKDESTTQCSMGCRVCGVLVHNTRTGDTWRTDKHWGKTLTNTNLHEAFHKLADNGYLQLADLLTGPGMLLDKLQQLAAVFRRQQCWHFYSTSLLLLYEGSAQTAADARLTVKLIDFAHAFPVVVNQDSSSACDALAGPSGIDENFLGGLNSLIALLREQLPTST